MGRPQVNIPNSADTRVLSFVRRNERDNVFAVLNFSADAHTVTFDSALCHGRYTDSFSSAPVMVGDATRMTLEPWGYRVLTHAEAAH